MRVIIISLIALLLGCQPMTGSSEYKADPKVKEMVKKIFDDHLTKGQAYEMLRDLSYKVGHRLSGSKGAEKAVQWGKAQMEKIGLDKVWLQEVMVPHWERGPKESAYAMIDGKRAEMSFIALGGSFATPQGGLKADVVMLEDLDDVDDAGSAGKLKDKIVYFNKRFNQTFIRTGNAYADAVGVRVRGASVASKYGAVGVVIRSMSSVNDDFPHTGTMRYELGVKTIPAGAVSTVDANTLETALKDGKSVEFFMQINSTHHDDKLSHNVIGEITGSEFPDTYILVGGHLDSWDVGHGAHDDGAGVVHTLDVARAMVKLGIKPRYSIRFVLFMNEENGLAGGNKYAEIAGQKKEKHVVAIESDAGGFTPRGFGISHSDTLLMKMRNWLAYFNPHTISYINNGGGGADIGPLNRVMGTATIGLIPDSQRYFDLHHTENDTFENVNRRELLLGAASMTSLVYLLDHFGVK